MITKNLTHGENTVKQDSDYLTQCVDLHLKTLLANIFPGILVIFSTVAFFVSHSYYYFQLQLFHPLTLRFYKIVLP